MKLQWSKPTVLERIMCCAQDLQMLIWANSANIGYIAYTRGVQPVARGKVLSGPWDFSEITNIINVIAT